MSGQTLKMRGDFGGEFTPFLRREIFFDDCRAECGEMLVQHIVLDAAQGVDDRRYLMRDAETVALGLDHFLQAPDLTFDASERRQLVSMLGARRVGRSFFVATFIFYQIRSLL